MSLQSSEDKTKIMAEDQNQEKPKKGDKTEDSKPKTEKKAQSLVRILGTDIDGSKSLVTGTAKVKGIGTNLANAIIKKLGMDPKAKLGKLSDPELEKIEKAIEDPAALGIPAWMLNRRKDFETGDDIHLNTADLDFAKKADLDLLGEIKSYKGLRHARGLKVRGQRTKSTGRGTASVGVVRKKTQPGSQ
jgi:small subunit ribosomal protein S13